MAKIAGVKMCQAHRRGNSAWGRIQPTPFCIFYMGVMRSPSCVCDWLHGRPNLGYQTRWYAAQIAGHDPPDLPGMATTNHAQERYGTNVRVVQGTFRRCATLDQ